MAACSLPAIVLFPHCSRLCQQWKPWVLGWDPVSDSCTLPQQPTCPEWATGWGWKYVTHVTTQVWGVTFLLHYPSQTELQPWPPLAPCGSTNMSTKGILWCMAGWRGRNRKKSIQMAQTQFNLTKSHNHKGSSRQMPIVTSAGPILMDFLFALSKHIVCHHLVLQEALKQLPSFQGMNIWQLGGPCGGELGQAGTTRSPPKPGMWKSSLQGGLGSARRRHKESMAHPYKGITDYLVREASVSQEQRHPNEDLAE